jgi:hypothetical protein
MTFLISACTILRKEVQKTEIKEHETTLSLELVKKLNITNDDFYIEKIEIEVLNGKQKVKLLGSMKYEKEGRYLISIKSKSGIEAVRLYLTKDTVLINDRIRKKLYCGSTQDLSDKYGISSGMLPLIAGDYIDESGNISVKCDSGKCPAEVTVEGRKVKYVIDYETRKPILARFINSSTTEEIVILFDKFIKINDAKIPKAIQIEDFNKETQVNIYIKKIANKNEDRIRFVPGNNYEKILIK